MVFFYLFIYLTKKRIMLAKSIEPTQNTSLYIHLDTQHFVGRFILIFMAMASTSIN